MGRSYGAVAGSCTLCMMIWTCFDRVRMSVHRQLGGFSREISTADCWRSAVSVYKCQVLKRGYTMRKLLLDVLVDLLAVGWVKASGICQCL